VLSPDIAVFAVEDTSIQLSWSRLPECPMVLEVAGRSFEANTPPPAWYRLPWGRPFPAGAGGPGALVVDGLEPATRYEVVLRGAHTPGRRVAQAVTLPAPPGRLLARFATISDLHIGERHVGLLRLLHDPQPRPDGLLPYPVRSALAAISEAEEWGAELIVAKGDLTREAEEPEARGVAKVLAGASVPVHAILGNHDVAGPADVVATLAAQGIAASTGARSVDLPGARLVLGHSPVSGLHSGRLERSHIEELIALTADSPGPVVLALHHPPTKWPVHTYYPPAISWNDSRTLMTGLGRANPSTVVLAGHTHRNRRYRISGLEVAEVGSTKDYPGQWAGYAVYEGAVRQVVRRTARTDVIAWTESTRRALGGVWGWWSQGDLADRCWTHEWDATP
jgi:predicted phosphodiesterase